MTMDVRNSEAVAFAIRERRKSKRLTQWDLARKLNWNQSVVAKIESGKPINMPMRKFADLCEALGLALVLKDKKVAR